MPELPEVQTFVAGLQPAVGRRIVSVDVLDGKLDLAGNHLLGSRILSISRRGKYIVLSLDPAGDLVIHLRMTGRVRLQCATDERKYARLIVGLDSGRSIFFVNPRRLGTAVFHRDGFATSLGVDPLDPEFTEERLAEILAGSRRPIKQLLMDQRRIAGLGNIYAAECLWRAGIDPRRPASSLSSDEVPSLQRAVVGVLSEAIDHLGTSIGQSISDYRPTPNEMGGFGNQLAVYGRDAAACKRCGHSIVRIRQAGRSTYLCSACQR